VIDIMMNGGASAVFHGMSEEEVQRIVQIAVQYVWQRCFHTCVFHRVPVYADERKITVEAKHTGLRNGMIVYGPAKE